MTCLRCISALEFHDENSVRVAIELFLVWVMPSVFRLAVVQMSASADKADNIERAVRMIEEASLGGASMVVLPECFNCPFAISRFGEYAEVIPQSFEEQREAASSARSPTYHAMRSASKLNSVWVVAGSIPELCSKTQRLFNTCMVFDDQGTLRGTFRKMHLFRINTEELKVDESEIIAAGDQPLVVDVDFGHINFKMGVGICFDGRFPQLALHYAHMGTSLLVFPSAFNMFTGPRHWELMGRSRAVDAQQFTVLASLARDTASPYVAYGHSMIVNPMGEKVAELDEKEGILYGDVDVDLVASSRAQLPILAGERSDLYSLTF